MQGQNRNRRTGTARLLLALGLVAVATSAHALKLGAPQVRSHLNEPLFAEVPIEDLGETKLNELSLRLLQPDEYISQGWQPPLHPLSDFAVSLQESFNPRLVIRTEQAVVDAEPLLLIEAATRDGREIHPVDLQVPASEAAQADSIRLIPLESDGRQVSEDRETRSESATDRDPGQITAESQSQTESSGEPPTESRQTAASEKPPARDTTQAPVSQAPDDAGNPTVADDAGLPTAATGKSMADGSLRQGAAAAATGATAEAAGAAAPASASAEKLASAGSPPATAATSNPTTLPRFQFDLQLDRLPDSAPAGDSGWHLADTMQAVPLPKSIWFWLALAEAAVIVWLLASRRRHQASRASQPQQREQPDMVELDARRAEARQRALQAARQRHQREQPSTRNTGDPGSNKEQEPPAGTHSQAGSVPDRAEALRMQAQRLRHHLSGEAPQRQLSMVDDFITAEQYDDAQQLLNLIIVEYGADEAA